LHRRDALWQVQRPYGRQGLSWNRWIKTRSRVRPCKP
jgi:hypothetical protein